MSIEGQPAEEGTFPSGGDTSGAGRGRSRTSSHSGRDSRRSTGSTRGGRGPWAAEPPEDADTGPDADQESVARTIVLRKLTAQARSREELAKALKQKQVPEEVSDQVLDRMEEVGLVDDTEFARSWVSSRQSRRHLSKGALRRELMTKGIDKDRIDEALEQVEPDDERAAAMALAQKKLRSMSNLERPVKYRRLAGALGRRGFGSGVVTSVLSEVLDADFDEDA